MPRGKKPQRSIKGFGFIYKPKYKIKSGEIRESAIFWLYYTPADGEPVRRSSGTRDQAAAYEQLVQLRADLGKGSMDGAGPERATFGMLFDLLKADYIQHKRSTLGAMTLVVNRWLRPRFGDMRVLELRKRHVDELRAEVLKDHKPATLNRILSHWHRSMALGMAEDPPLVLRIPAWFGQVAEDNARTGVITYEQYRRLREALPDHAALLLTIGYHLGMRSGEIRGLRWDQVDLENGVIRLEAAQTKGKTPRTAPIYGELGPALEMAFSARDPKCPYVVQYRGQRVKASMWKTWRRACELAEVPGALIHDLRRTAATNMRRAGIDQVTVMRIVGWKTLSLFLRYNITGPEDTERARETMGAWMHDQRKRAESKPKARAM